MGRCQSCLVSGQAIQEGGTILWELIRGLCALRGSDSVSLYAQTDSEPDKTDERNLWKNGKEKWSDKYEIDRPENVAASRSRHDWRVRAKHRPSILDIGGQSTGLKNKEGRSGQKNWWQKNPLRRTIFLPSIFLPNALPH